MNPSTPLLLRVAAVLLAVLVPVVLVLTNVRLLLTPAYVDLAYRVPGFPDDPYGMSMEDRERHADIDLDYLLNDAGPEFLGDLRFEDGTPAYNAREVRHMVDVKRLVQAALRVWIGALVVGVVVGLILWRSGGGAELRLGVHWGSQASLIAIGVLTVGLMAAFGILFVGFHRLFFEGDTWLFLNTDTLIRLFPVRFWQQAFITLAGLTLVESAVLFAVTKGAGR
jgi:integral membrane protein (TIGR01906 family)